MPNALSAACAAYAQLAFTLLGVDFDERTGDIRYLIMDPHFQGADDLALIQPKWVGWKSGDSLTHLNTKLFKPDTERSQVSTPTDVVRAAATLHLVG